MAAPRNQLNRTPAATKVLKAIGRRIAPTESPDFVSLYQRAAQQTAAERNPVIVIPGILGSRLIDRESGVPIWAFRPRNTPCLLVLRCACGVHPVRLSRKAGS